MKGIWYLVRVENEKDIGIVEIERWKVVDSNTTSVNIGGDFNYQSMNIKCDKAVPASPITKELPATPKRPPISTTQCSETEDSHSTEGKRFGDFIKGKVVTVETDEGSFKVWESKENGKPLEERIKSLEEWQTQADIEYDANETWKQQMNILCVKKFEDIEKDVKELKAQIGNIHFSFDKSAQIRPSDAIDIKKRFNKLHGRIQQVEETTCTNQHLKEWMERLKQHRATDQKVVAKHQEILQNHRKELDYIKQQLSELQIAFVKKLGEPTIEAGQFVERNPDGSIRPCKTGETPYGMTVKPIYCKECGKGFAQLNIDENGICCMCSQLEKYREKPPAESDPLEEADKQLKGIIHNLLTEKGIRIEFV